MVAFLHRGQVSFDVGLAATFSTRSDDRVIWIQSLNDQLIIVSCHLKGNVSACHCLKRILYTIADCTLCGLV